MRPLIVVGPRPEGIKCAPVIRALPECIILTTGQHDVSATLAYFGITADYAFPLGIDLTDNIHDVSRAIRHCDPDLVIVEGDTNATIAGAIAAHQLGKPIAHVEAGLRTGRLDNPWPEEGWRRMVSAVTTYHFAPTERAAANLKREGITENVYVTGNTIIDAVRLLGAKRTTGGPDILVELHRRESIGAPLREACEAVADLATRYNVTVLAHPNPHVRAIVRDVIPDAIEPLAYPDFIALMASSRIVLSDSGGLQEESSYLGVPMLVARESSERMEAVEAGASVLVGTRRDAILQTAERLLTDGREYGRMSTAGCPFGDGHAAERIAAVLG